MYAISYVQVLKSSRWLPFVQLPEMNITILQFPFDDIQNSQSRLLYRTSVPVTGKMEGVVRMIGFHALGYHIVLLCHINCECMRCAGSTYKHDNGMNKAGPHFLTYRSPQKSRHKPARTSLTAMSINMALLYMVKMLFIFLVIPFKEVLCVPLSDDTGVFPIKKTFQSQAMADIGLRFVSDSGVCETTPGVHQMSGYITVGQNMSMVNDFILYIWQWFSLLMLRLSSGSGSLNPGSRPKPHHSLYGELPHPTRLEKNVELLQG